MRGNPNKGKTKHHRSKTRQTNRALIEPIFLNLEGQNSDKSVDIRRVFIRIFKSEW